MVGNWDPGGRVRTRAGDPIVFSAKHNSIELVLFRLRDGAGSLTSPCGVSAGCGERKMEADDVAVNIVGYDVLFPMVG